LLFVDPACVEGHYSVQENLKRIDIYFHKHHAYPVLDLKSRLIGMITHQEMETQMKVGATNSILELVQHQNSILLKPELSIREAAKILVDNDLVHASVVSSKDDRKLVGILTFNDITRQQNLMEDSLDR
jgi:chloride channel protein, CIC family